MIINISHLANITSDVIMQALATNYNEIILGAKMIFTKKGRSHLEIIFHTFKELQHHVSTGITLLGQTCLGYYASKNDRNYLNISMRNMPITNMQKILEEIKDTFTGICSIASIKPLYFAGTKILTDQWQVTLDITDKEHVIEKIPRIVIFMGRKINLSWKNALTICFFYEKTGHFKRTAQI